MEENKMKGEAKSDMITIKKDALWKYSTFALIGVLVLVMLFFVLPGKSTTGNVVAGNNNPTLPGVVEKADIKLSNDDHFLKGNADSKVVIVEYSDFECPFCERAYSDAVKKIKQTYSDSDVAIVYRHFPLTQIHQNAQKAAEASECAAEQGKFNEMHDVLFEQRMGSGVPTFKQYAVNLGLDTAKFNKCLDDDKYADKVEKSTQEGSSFGVQGTPAFFVNGGIISGACPFDATFAKVIEAEKDGKKWAVTQCQFAKL